MNLSETSHVNYPEIKTLKHTEQKGSYVSNTTQKSTVAQGWGGGSEVLLEQVQLNFSFPNKFIIILPCGLLVDNNTFSKMRIFKSLTSYTDDGG